MTERPKPDPDNALDKWVLPYVRQAELWPVLLALLGHVWVVFALAMLSAWRAGNPLAYFPLGVLLFFSAGSVRWEVRERGGLGAVTVLLSSC